MIAHYGFSNDIILYGNPNWKVCATKKRYFLLEMVEGIVREIGFRKPSYNVRVRNWVLKSLPTMEDIML